MFTSVAAVIPKACMVQVDFKHSIEFAPGVSIDCLTIVGNTMSAVKETYRRQVIDYGLLNDVKRASFHTYDAYTQSYVCDHMMA